MTWSSESFALMTEKMELAFDVQKMSIIMLMIIVNLLPGVSGLILTNTNATECDGSRANITFDFDLENGTIPSGSEAWYYEATVIATIFGGSFTPQGKYSSRLHTYSTYGIALDNVTVADAGRYLFVFSYRSPTPQGLKTATATLTVKVGPLNPSSPSGCLVKASQSGNTVKCTVSGNCGTPPLIPSWVNVTTSDQFECNVSGTYQCCATGDVLPLCYAGSSNDFCTSFKCDNSTQWWCTCGWCIGLCVTSGGLLFISVVIGIIIFSKKRKDIENNKRWQISTITIAVLVVIIIVVTSVLAGIVCHCCNYKKIESQY